MAVYNGVFRDVTPRKFPNVREHSRLAFQGLGDATFDSAVSQYQAALQQLYQAETDLLNVRSDAQGNSDLASQWQTQYDKVDALIVITDMINSGASDVAVAFARAENFVTSLFGRQQLGLVPLVIGALEVSAGTLLAIVAGIAAAVASVYALIAIVNQYVASKQSAQFQSTVSAYEAQGYSAQDALNLATQQLDATTAAQLSTSFGTQVKQVILWGIAGLVAVMVLPKMLEKK